MRPQRPAVFLDRDGTINEEVEYLRDPALLRLLPGAVEALRLLNRREIPVFVVTNQAGVGRGYFTSADVEAVHERLNRILADRGVHVHGIDFCPHHPDDACSCRKPKPGMLMRAAREHGFDLQRCFMVGDKLSDVEAGQNAGCRTVLVLTGYGEAESRRGLASGLMPDHIAPDLEGAARWIVDQVDGPRE